MSRNPRIHRPGAFYHVMLRGNNGQKIFFSDRDRCKCCLLLQQGVERFGYRIHGFCLMSNHIHLIVQVGTIPLSKIIQHFATSYAIHINSWQNRIGHLFQGRFKAILIDEAKYLAELSRYVHLNPVRADIVTRPENYLWSSYKTFMGISEISWITQDLVLKKFHDHELSARKIYIEYVLRGIGQKINEELFLGSHASRILGDDQFAENVFEIIPDRYDDESKIKRISINDLVSMVSEVFQQPISDLQSRQKRQELTHARGAAALLVRENSHLSVSLKDLSNFLAKDASSLSRLASDTQHKAQTDQELSEAIEKVRQRIKDKVKIGV